MNELCTYCKYFVATENKCGNALSACCGVVVSVGCQDFKAIEKQSKYAWHDLRKDPNDLPTTPTQVLTATSGYDYEVGEYWGEQGGWGEVSSEVIAWKQIEPFEEDICKD